MIAAVMPFPYLPFPSAVLSPLSEAGASGWMAKPGALLAVNRIIDDVRRGAMAGLSETAANLSVGLGAVALEATTADYLTCLRDMHEQVPRIVMTGRRAVVLGLWPHADHEPPKVVSFSGELADIIALAVRAVDPFSSDAPLSTDAYTITEVAADGPDAAAVHLMKRARLMPAAAVMPITNPAPSSTPMLWAHYDDVLHHEHLLALSLQPVSEASVPLADSPETRVIAFRPSDGGIEHLALVIGNPKPGDPVLARLHSECFTGDLLGSLRCDCGEQLRGAIQEIAKAGAGILLYMAQEGRGIGLVNKLRAYGLQDAGFDTMEANEQLGFDDDERIYLPAAAMLRLLGFDKVRLMTNNPFKVEALSRHGVDVTERVPHIFPSNDHNIGYLETKRIKGGHLF